jgi:hypothetical protein
LCLTTCHHCLKQLHDRDLTSHSLYEQHLSFQRHGLPQVSTSSSHFPNPTRSTSLLPTPCGPLCSVTLVQRQPYGPMKLLPVNSSRLCSGKAGNTPSGTQFRNATFAHPLWLNHALVCITCHTHVGAQTHLYLHMCTHSAPRFRSPSRTHNTLPSHSSHDRCASVSESKGGIFSRHRGEKKKLPTPSLTHLTLHTCMTHP